MNNINWKEYAEKIFGMFDQKYEATIIQNDNSFFIADWEDSNGSGNLATRYILDKKKGTLIITGDSGNCVALWHHKCTPGEVSEYLNNVNYFIQKIKCSTNIFKYEWKDVEEDINQEKEVYLKIINDENDELIGDFGVPITEEQCNKEFNEMLDVLYEHWDIYKGCSYSERFDSLMSKYNSCWWECTNYGERIDERLYLWIYGYKKCIEKLSEE